jgi:hypothetical protein
MRKLLAVTTLVMVLGAVLLAPTYLRYRRGAGAVPPWVHLGEIDVGGGDADEVAEALNRQFAEPVALYYGDHRVILRPYEIGFQVDTQTLLSEARRHDTSNRLLSYLVSRALDRPIDPIDVPLRFTVDQVALDNFLADVAALTDLLLPNRLDPDHRTRSARPGARLVASREQVLTC